MNEETVAEIKLETSHAERITTILFSCDKCLKDVQDLVTKYNGLPVSTQRSWERTEWNVEELSEHKAQLSRNVGLLGALNSSLASTSQAAVKAMLQKFMDEVRDGKREGSTVSSHSVDSLSLDEREAWRLLRKELEDVGITPHLFEQHKDSGEMVDQHPPKCLNEERL